MLDDDDKLLVVILRAFMQLPIVEHGQNWLGIFPLQFFGSFCFFDGATQFFVESKFEEIRVAELDEFSHHRSVSRLAFSHLK